MFYSPDSSIDEFLVHGTHVLNYLELQSEAQSLLARYGMDGMRLQEGRLLLNQVQTTQWLMRDQRRQQKASTILFHSEWTQARQLYRRHRQAARDVLGRDATVLLQPGPRSYAIWLSHAQEFYTAMLDNVRYLEKLSTVDVTLDQLQRASQQLDAIVVSKTAQTQNREGTRTSKHQRDQHLLDAKNWFEVLMSIAQVAYRNQPGMIEAIYTLPEHLSKEQKAKKLARAEAAKQRKLAKSSTANGAAASSTAAVVAQVAVVA